MNHLFGWCKSSVITQILNCVYTGKYYIQGKRHCKKKVILTLCTVTNVSIDVLVYAFAFAFKTSRIWKIWTLVIVDTGLVHGNISYYKKASTTSAQINFLGTYYITRHTFLYSLMLISNTLLLLTPMLALRASPDADYPDNDHDWK